MAPTQTTILEGQTKRTERVFEALFKVVSTLFGLRNVEKCVEKSFRTVCSYFQNLLLGSINFIHPKRRFWKVCVFEALVNVL
jgi:hypothetical protein